MLPIDVVIVDDSTSLATKQLIDSFLSKFSSLGCKLKYLRGDESGVASATNLGVSSCLGEFVCLLDDDTKLDPRCLSELAGFMDRNPSVGAAQPKILRASDGNSIDCAGVILNVVGFGRVIGQNEKDFGQYDFFQAITFAKGAAIIVRKNIWTHLGGYDSLFFFHFQESDFCWRLWLFGYKVMFVPYAKVFHAGGATSFKNRRNVYNDRLQRFLFYRNRIIMVVKNLELRTAVIYFPWLASMSAYYLTLNFVRGDPESVVGNLRGIGWCIRHFKVIWLKRLTIQNMRLLSDKELFRKEAISKKIFL